MSRQISDLSDAMRPRAECLVNKLSALGIKYYINETRRSEIVQRAYYAQGREPLTEVNKKRAEAGLYLISEAENKIITKTLKSKHIDGNAIDIVPVNPDGKLWWNAPAHIWGQIGMIGESCDLAWGGRWGAKDGKLGWDCPHFELP